jgi:hypothetical protein
MGNHKWTFHGYIQHWAQGTESTQTKQQQKTKEIIHL